MNKKYMININNKTKLVDKTYPLAPPPRRWFTCNSNKCQPYASDNGYSSTLFVVQLTACCLAVISTMMLLLSSPHLLLVVS